MQFLTELFVRKPI